MLRILGRIVGIFVLSGLAALLASPSATAHVDAILDGGGPGETGLITLRVPGERNKPATTKVEVRIPDDVQIRTVLAQPVPGWRLDIKKKKPNPPMYRDDGTPVDEVVSSVTWTATGPGIQRGEFDDFVLEAGPLPDVESLALPTYQTFVDGTTDAWTEPAPEGSDPEFPVPSVNLGASSDVGSSAGGGMTSVIAWTALGFAVIAVALGIFSIDRARRSAHPASPSAEPSPERSAFTE
ncbi:YcnI family protein [Mycolicibacterium sp. 120270]|uniref:YcnI family copper-binding membrane protein n=1 Tax=Mycolicibacterium sp. 120270 TaxID=3090600 RepID=UPI00299DE6C2|nr:YcnI family protein [Mycolicibacterium sp. 120270]MDX1884455.1 YcnI family protein [Mycolicibacterium sp. 120270]